MINSVRCFVCNFQFKSESLSLSRFFFCFRHQNKPFYEILSLIRKKWQQTCGIECKTYIGLNHLRQKKNVELLKQRCKKTPRISMTHFIWLPSRIGMRSRKQTVAIHAIIFIYFSVIKKIVSKKKKKKCTYETWWYAFHCVAKWQKSFSLKWQH